MRWVSVPPETRSQPPSIMLWARTLALSATCLRILLEGGLQRLAEGHGLGGDHMLQRAALQAGEDGGVELLAEVVIAAEDHAAARAAQRLVGGGGDHIGVFERIRMHAAGHEAGEMGHVHHQVGAHRVGDLAEALEVE